MKKVLSVMLFLFIIISSYAMVSAEGIEDIFDGDNDFLILGTVTGVADDIVAVTVDNTVGEKVASLTGKEIKIHKFSYSYCEEHTPTSFNNPQIGDNLFASISKDSDKYRIANGVYKVDSSEVKNCSTLVHQNMRNQDCLADAVKLAYFVRSNGKIKDFKVDSEGNIYALKEDDEVLVYPLVGNQQCIKFVDNNGKILDETVHDDVIPIVPQPVQEETPDNNKWIWATGIFVGGALLGFLVMIFIYSKKRL